MHMLTIDAQAIQNLAHCVRRCDLELAGIASSSYVSGISALVEDEQELGAACIDMGGGATGISIFIKKHMIYADAVRMGGDHVTSDISMGLQVPMTNAERIKTFYGGVVATGMDDREMIEIGGETGDWEHDRRTVSRAELIGIMRPRVEEILEEVRARLDAAGFDHLPSQQIVLTGGASQIPGLDGLATKILGQQVRLGRPLAGPWSAAGGDRAGLCLVGGPLPLCGASAGRMVGFRDPGGPLPRPSPQARGAVVPRQLVRTERGRGGDYGPPVFPIPASQFGPMRLDAVQTLPGEDGFLERPAAT